MLVSLLLERNEIENTTSEKEAEVHIILSYTLPLSSAVSPTLLAMLMKHNHYFFISCHLISASSYRSILSFSSSDQDFFQGVKG